LGGLEDMSFLHECQALDAISRKIYMLKRSNVDVDSVEVGPMTAITPFIASKLPPPNEGTRALWASSPFQSLHSLAFYERNGR